MDFRTDIISQEALEQHIDQQMVGYTTSYVNTLKIPSLIARCEEEIAEDMPTEKREMYEKQIEAHKRQIKTDAENMVSLSEIYDRLVNFQTQCQK